jgi:hypothetical protein
MKINSRNSYTSSLRIRLLEEGWGVFIERRENRFRKFIIFKVCVLIVSIFSILWFSQQLM